MKLKKRGFTIVELIIVIAVIAILAAVLIPTSANVTKNAKASRPLQEVKSGWDDYLPTIIDTKLPDRKSIILYRNYGCDFLFEAEGVSFIGPLSEERANKLRNDANTVDAELTVFCDYEYDAGTQKMNRLHTMNNSNTTKPDDEHSLIGGWTNFLII